MIINKNDIDIILSTKVDWSQLYNKKILVTGATGRLGIYIVNVLQYLNMTEKANIGIYLLSRNKKKIEEYYPIIDENLSILFQDITEPINIDSDIDYIFHTAGLASPSDFSNRPTETYWGHIMGTKNVLDLAKRKNVKKVLYVSTVEIYGYVENEDGIHETDIGPIAHSNARACYSEAKRACETMLACYKADYGLEYSCVRMSHTIGPGVSLSDGRAFAEFIAKMLEGKDIILQSNGEAIRTYTYTADAVGAMFLVLLNGEEEYYNVAAVNNAISTKDLAELIASFDDSRKCKVVFSNGVGNGLTYLPFKLGIMNVDKISELGWKPKADLRKSFEWTIDSFR